MYHILIVNDGSSQFPAVVDTIVAHNPDVNIHVHSNINDANIDFAPYQCAVILSEQADDDLLAQIKAYARGLSATNLIVLAPASCIDTAHFCYLDERFYFLALETLSLLPAMFTKVRADIAARQKLKETVQAQHKALVELASHATIQAGHFEKALQLITKVASELLDVRRVSIWLYDDQQSRIRCQKLYDAVSGKYNSGLEITKRQFPAYFAALEKNRVIAADDAHNHPATSEFSESYLTPFRITALLDAPIRLSGRMVGIICIEHTRTQRQWHHLEQQFAGSLADLVAHVMQNQARQRIEETLETRENYLKEAETLGRLGHFKFNLHDYSIFWSDETYRIFGLPVRSPISMDLYQSLLAPEDFDRVMAHVDNLTRTGTPYSIEHDIVLLDGTRKQTLAIARPLYDDNNNIVKIFGIIQDITQIKQAEKQRLELELQQQKISVLKEFVDAMTHDLKAPITVIQSSSYLIRRKLDNETFMPYLDRIDTQTERLTKMLDDLLTISRLENMPPTTFTQIEINAFIQQITKQLSDKAEDKSINLIFEPHTEIIKMHVLPDEFTRALVNLVDNAINYTPQDGSVTIRCQREREKIICIVQDTGIGIPEQDLPHVFEQFYRSDNARSFTSGTGLGLAIVKKIIDLHRGTISVQSSANEGTTFTITFNSPNLVEDILR